MTDQKTQQIPANWEKNNLGEMAKINPTESLPKGTLSKYVAMENLEPFSRKIRKYELKEFNGGMKFRNGDTLFARITPCLENGKTAYVDILDEDEVGFGSTEYIVIREKNQVSDSKFLYYFAMSSYFRDIAIKSMTGTSGRQRVQTNSLIGNTFLFPSFPEQQAIASVLSAFDDKIELLREQNKTLEAIAQTLFNRWFVEFNFPDENGQPYLDSDGNMIDSELGEIPEGWRVGKLGDVVEHVRDGINPSDFPEKDFSHYSIPAFDQNKQPSIDKGKSILSNKYSVPSYSFLVSKLNPRIPRVWTVFEVDNSICSTEFQVLKPIKKGFFSFAHCILNSDNFMKEIASKVQGTSSSHQRVRPEDMLLFEFAIPNDELVIHFENISLPILDKINFSMSQIQTLSLFRDTLLPKLISGELRIKF